jgi:hypothetical protein
MSECHANSKQQTHSVNEAPGMNVFDALQHLVSQHQDSLTKNVANLKLIRLKVNENLHRKATMAFGEQILQRLAQQVNHHAIVVTLHGEEAEHGNANAALKMSVDPALVHELRVACL